jgi:hypothetical protein
VLTQLAWRAALLELWARDALGESARNLEEALAAIPDPPHPTALAAGLGRLLGALTIRRLRRAEGAGGCDGCAGLEALALRALTLAPEDLATRIAANDLRFHAGRDRCGPGSGWDADLLASLLAERERWDGVTVGAMGRALSRALGDRSRQRQFSGALLDRALADGGCAAWILAASLALEAPPSPRSRLGLDSVLDAAARRRAPRAEPLARIVLGKADPEEQASAAADLESALLGARLALDEAATLEPAMLAAGGGSRTRGRAPAWKQILAAGTPSPGDSEWAARCWTWLQSLRAAAPALREPPVAGAVRSLLATLSRHADSGEQRQQCGATAAPLADLGPRMSVYLGSPGVPGAASGLAAWIEEASAPLRVAGLARRLASFDRELAQAQGRARARGDAAGLRQLQALRSELREASVRSDAQCDVALDALEARFPKEASPRPVAGPAADEPLGGATQEPASSVATMRFHDDFDRFSSEELGMRPDALRRAREMVRLFNESGGRRDRRRLRGDASTLFELRHRTAASGGLRVYYRPEGAGWLALCAMSKYDDRQQREAIARVLGYFC